MNHAETPGPMTMFVGIPLAAMVAAHAATYPVIDHTGHCYGGLWVARDPEACLGRNFPSFLRLEVRDGRVMMWNGFALVQPLDECEWAARSLFRPVDPHGMPVMNTQE
ncbi:hypothetical protein EKD04_025160 [Chloroflexales bacterium ZM16-3]|nr:hypothetical protein [Chloroflexales bacterium ZM16-3]